MSDIVAFEPGGYRYARGPFQYSAGVAADPGFSIERVRFRRVATLADGFNIWGDGCTFKTRCR